MANAGSFRDVPVIPGDMIIIIYKKAVLSQREPRDAAKFDTYRILQQHCAVSLPQQGFLVGLSLLTAVNYLSKGNTP